MQKLRFVKSKKDPNCGWSLQEIEALQEKTKIHFPEKYFLFLQKAGKHSNLFIEHFENVDALMALQKQFKKRLAANEEATILQNEIWCVGSNKQNDDTFYYFFQFNQDANPLVFAYSFDTILIDNGHNHQRIGLSKRGNFVEFINAATEYKFGYTPIKAIIKYSALLLFSPILLPIFLYFKIKKKFF